MKSKIVALILSVAMFATLLSGCGTSNTEPSSNDSSTQTEVSSTEQKSDTEEIANKELAEFTFASSIWGNETVEDESWMEQYIQDALNVDITVVKWDSSSMNTMVATQQMPDCFWDSGNFTPAFLEENGAVRTIPVSMVEEYAPSAMEFLNENPAILKMCQNPDNPEELRFLRGMTYQFVNRYNYCCYLRYDWIENLGIDLGVEVEEIYDKYYVAKEGITYSKWMEIMDAFVNNDPDGNGVDDTFGITGDGIMHAEWFGAYGFHSGVNEVNGEAEMYYALDEYKDFLKDFARLYKEGLIDADLLLNDRTYAWDKMNNGTAGLMTGACSWTRSGNVDRPPIALLQNQPDAEVLIIPGIRPDDGELQQSYASALPAYGWFYVNANVDDELLARILEFVEWTVFQTEDYTRKLTLFNGEEGVNWEYDENGYPVWTNLLSNGVNGTDTFVQFGQDGGIPENPEGEPVWSAGAKYWCTIGDAKAQWISDYYVYEYKNDLFEETDYAALSAEYSGDLSEYVLNYATQAIVGELDVDSTWDEYLAELDRLGYNELMAELDKLEPLADVVSK